MSKNSVEVTPEEYSQYDAQLNEVKDDILSHLNSDEWVFSQDAEDGCKIFTRKIPTSSYTMIKATISVPVDKEKLFEIIKPCEDIDENTPKEKREGLDERKLINYDENDPTARAFMYCRSPSPVFLVAPRDFLVYRKRIDADNKICYIHTSVKNDRIMPEREGIVRGNMHQQAFILEDDEENKGSTKLSFILHTEVGGNIPAFAYNIAATSQGKSIIGLRRRAIDYMKSIQ